jgi:hypothetical protein
MIWFIFCASALVSGLLAFTFLRLRFPIGVAGLVSPLAAVSLVFIALRLKYSLFELGPLIVVPFVPAFLISLIVSSVLCWRAVGKSA